MIGVGHDLRDADLIRERLEASYTEAEEALDYADGDVLGALSYIERARAEKAGGLQNAISTIMTRSQSLAQRGIKSLEFELGGKKLGKLDLSVVGPLAFGLAVGIGLLKLLQISIIEQASEEAEEEAAS